MKPVAAIPPDNYGTPQWLEWRKPFEEVAAKRGEADPVAWADNYLRHDQDAADLRALGRCLVCKAPIMLRQYRRVVVMEPCGHYRAHGELAKMGKFMEGRRVKMTPERRAALLALVE